MPRRTNTRTAAQTQHLRYSLVLNKYILSLFGAKDFDTFCESLKDPRLEAYDSDNISLFYHEIVSKIPSSSPLTREQLLAYDANIYRHTKAISEKRQQKIAWKYFQYLSLLFTELYLDRYFSDRVSLLEDLNTYLNNTFNNLPDTFHEVAPFTPQDLNKLAYWNATGSGKTLLMHVNILQYLHYSKGRNLNKVLLLTTDEGLSRQHIDELTLSSISAQGFIKSGGSMYNGRVVEVIEITKLADTDGEKTVAVDSFEGNNLVLVDEGHRGSSGNKWKPFRDKLSEQGFSFEYSATFGQAISAASGKAKKQLLSEYGKATIFDYSYKYFYGDGFGKDYQILNINNAWDDDTMNLYLTASLLSFYEQSLLFSSRKETVTQFLLEKPLAIYVGSSVSAVRTVNGREESDVVTILRFFTWFIDHPEEAQDNIERLLNSRDALVDAGNHPIFARSFKYLKQLGHDAHDVYAGILKTVFNTTSSGAVLHLDNMKGMDGEIGMRVGLGDYFGVISVGDESKLLKLCNGIVETHVRDFANKSLFAGINNDDSKINILIGAKKFNTGWNSWRVSAMCLLNVGTGEGSEIIQLFGRGVRLKGYNYSLKRSSALDPSITPASGIPDNLGILETLNIYGVRANYMEQFKQYLQEEGVPTNDSEFEEITIPVLPVFNLGKKKLKYLKIKDGADFLRDVKLTLSKDTGTFVKLDYYPKVQMLKSRTSAIDSVNTELNQGYLLSSHLSLVDWDKVFYDVVTYKNERGWYNLTVDEGFLSSLLSNTDWYDLRIPAEDLRFDDYGKRKVLWENLATTLLKLYVERFYNLAKSKWMSDNAVAAYLDENDPNFIKEYNILIHRDLDDIIGRLIQLREKLENREFQETFELDKTNLGAIFFARHLYQPLLYMSSKAYISEETGEKLIEMKPVALNEGERGFVNDLKSFYESTPEFFEGKELYLLRNQSRNGIGFFEASGFYPDFILWLIVGHKQYVTFIDPKGIRNLDGGMQSHKIQLFNSLKSVIANRINDPDMTLDSFIIANTHHSEVRHWQGGETMEGFNRNHVYFQKEQKSQYVNLMLRSILGDTSNHQ